MRSCCCSSSAALVTVSPGSVVGMYIRVPSFSVGMNSAPMRLAGRAVTASTASASAIVAALWRSTSRISGR